MNLTGPHPGWQERTIQLLGEEEFSRLQDANVLVVGMGGVGSMAAEMICRSGVGKMCIIDGDTVQAGNINRQIPATHRSLGRGKAEVMGERLKDINPGLELTVLNKFIKEERIPFFVKMPNQNTSQEIASPFNAINTRHLIERHYESRSLKKDDIKKYLLGVQSDRLG